MERTKVDGGSFELRVVDGAADALAALEATTTVEDDALGIRDRSAGDSRRDSVDEPEAGAGAAARAGRHVATADGPRDDRVLTWTLGCCIAGFGVVVGILACMRAGVIADPTTASLSGLHWVLAAVGVVITFAAAWLAVRASRVRDGHAAGIAAGFGLAAGLVTVAEVALADSNGTALRATVIALSLAVLTGATGLVVVFKPAGNLLLRPFVSRSWLSVTLIAVPLVAAAVIVLIGSLSPSPISTWPAVAAGIIASAISVWAITHIWNESAWRLRVRVVAVFGSAALLTASYSLAVGVQGRLSETLAAVFVLVSSGVLVGLMIADLIRGMRTAEAMERIFEWAPEDETARYLSEAAEVLLDALEGDDLVGPASSNQMIQHSIGLGRELHLSSSRLRVLGLGAMFHDVGTETIPDEILNKPEALTPSERRLVQTHSETGYAMASRVHLLWEAALAIRHHHEWVDGSGYPDGLCGEEIPIEARAIAVADMFDALTTARPYRDALGTDEALFMMRAEVDSHLDRRCYEAFVRYLQGPEAMVLPFQRPAGSAEA